MEETTLKQVRVMIRGGAPHGSPLLMHHYAGEKPSAVKPPRGKKTQDHIDEHMKAQWMEAAYYDKVGSNFYLPGEAIDAMLIAGAKRTRNGPLFKSSVFTEEDKVPLLVFKNDQDAKGRIANGPLEEWYRDEYKDIRGVRVQMARIDRCRPIFRQWGLSFTINYEAGASGVTVDQLKAALHKQALGDYRPRFGRFKVVEFQEI